MFHNPNLVRTLTPKLGNNFFSLHYEQSIQTPAHEKTELNVGQISHWKQPMD